MSANPEARELHVLLDAASFQRLPACLQEPNLAIQLVPVLFVQGVDIKQSLSNRSGEKEGSGPRFQMSLNRKYFQLVSNACLLNSAVECLDFLSLHTCCIGIAVFHIYNSLIL